MNIVKQDINMCYKCNEVVGIAAALPHTGIDKAILHTSRVNTREYQNCMHQFPSAWTAIPHVCVTSLYWDKGSRSWRQWQNERAMYVFKMWMCSMHKNCNEQNMYTLYSYTHEISIPFALIISLNILPLSVRTVQSWLVNVSRWLTLLFQQKGIS